MNYQGNRQKVTDIDNTTIRIRYCKQLYSKLRHSPRWMRLMTGCILALIACSFLQAVVTIADGLTDEIGTADFIVVFGNTVQRDGTPSARLEARLIRALDLYRQKWAPRIMVSGGVGKEGFDEAIVMRDWLTDRGVPTNDIAVDQNGYDSKLTARAAAKAIRDVGGGKVLIVTQYWHVMRARLAMRQAGISTVYSAHARFFALRDLYSISREIPAYWKYALF